MRKRSRERTKPMSMRKVYAGPSRSRASKKLVLERSSAANRMRTIHSSLESPLLGAFGSTLIVSFN